KWTLWLTNENRYRKSSLSHCFSLCTRGFPAGELPTACKNTKAKILALALIFSLNLWPPVRASYLLLVKIKEREPALFTLILAFALALILALTPCPPVRASCLLLML